jgi:hypothetical protein
MDDKKRSKRYLHQANAIASWGHIIRPLCEPVPTQAALALPVTGGYGSARVDGFRFREIFSFGSAYTEVAGSEHGPDGPFDTLALSVVEKLDISGVVTCERLVARLSSRREIGKPEPEITTVGTRFERLRIGNLFFEELDLGTGPVCECETWTQLQKGFQDGKRRELLGPSLMTAPNGDRVELPDGKQMPYKVGLSLAPTCGRASNIKEVPWSIPVPQFGTVYLGEMFISQFSRQLVMLRVEMGCPLSGGTGAGGGSTGSDTYP